MKDGEWAADTKCSRGHGAKQEGSRRLGVTGFVDRKSELGSRSGATYYLRVPSHQAAASPLKFKPHPPPLSFASCIRLSLKFLIMSRISLGLKPPCRSDSTSTSNAMVNFTSPLSTLLETPNLIAHAHCVLLRLQPPCVQHAASHSETRQPFLNGAFYIISAKFPGSRHDIRQRSTHPAVLVPVESPPPLERGHLSTQPPETEIPRLYRWPMPVGSAKHRTEPFLVNLPLC